METWNKAVNFEDGRGAIRDIITHTPLEHVTIITSKAGAVRGNHYHKESTQYDYVVSGKMRILSQTGDGPVLAVEALPGTLVKHEPGESHSLIALEDSVFLSLTEGTRGGTDYEKDTYRLETPLPDPAA